MVHRLGLGRNRKSGRRVFWIRLQMKRFSMATHTLDLALVIPGRDVVSCLLGNRFHAVPNQQTHVDAQPSTMFMSAGLD